MKLIKLSSDHYIIVDENRDIHENDYTFKNGEIREVSFLMQDNGCVITHSTQLDKGMDNVTFISLSEVKKLLGEVDVEKMAEERYPIIMRTITKIGGGTYDTDVNFSDRYSYKNGYNQALEDNKVKVYTEEDMKKAIEFGHTSYTPFADVHYLNFIQSLQPPTSWDVEFVDGKLKLL